MIETSKSTSESPGGDKPDPGTSIDLWKFFEERGSKLKESMFKVVTWIIGFAALVVGFAVKEGFSAGSLTSVKDPAFVAGLGVIGLLLLSLAVIVIYDYGNHINRTFARADAARDGASTPKAIWEAGKNVRGEPFPTPCRHLILVISLFVVGCVFLIALSVAQCPCRGLA